MKAGYFDDKNREYVITQPDTPKPWCNYLGDSSFGAVVTNQAAGYTFYKSAAQGRLTRFRFNGPPADYPGKYLYFHDADTGTFWSNSWSPVIQPKDEFEYLCRHGSGYTTIESTCHDIASKVTYFIPLGKTYEVWQVEVTNRSSASRELRLFPFVETPCNWNAEDDTRNLQYTQFISRAVCREGMIDIGSNVNMPTDPDNFENKDQKRHTFFALAGIEAAGYDCDLETFFGPFGSYGRPAAVESGTCNQSASAGDMPCAALQVNICLQPGESCCFAVLFGVGQAGEEGKQAQAEMATPVKREQALQVVKDHWHGRLNSLHVQTPDAAFDSMANMWAPYNNLMTFYWSRTASLVYAGERDGLGYRDSLQDIVGASMLVTEEAAERLSLLLTGQLQNGGAMSVVKPFAHHPGHEPEPDHYRADDALWLFNAVPAYVKETGCIDYYRQILPYADQGEGTVFDHLKRAIQFSLEHSGAHGLPCGLFADWNDCLRLGEKGESVFVAFQLRYALREYIDIAMLLKEDGEADWAELQLARLDGDLAEHAWDGEWYLRAYRYDGLKFGSHENPEGSIFMNAQTWAVWSGHATGDRAEKAMAAMQEHLDTDYGIMLCTPPYVETDPQVALGRLMNPGMKENGGIFNHTQGWAVLAATVLGQPDLAWKYLSQCLPARFNEMAEVRQVEPYVVCQSTHSRFSPRFGAGRLSWLSGSAVWNYVAMTQAILGIQPDYHGLRLRPCLPSHWEGYEASRQFRGCTLEITVSRDPEQASTLRLNGQLLEGDLIPTTLLRANETNVISLSV